MMKTQCYDCEATVGFPNGMGDAEVALCSACGDKRRAQIAVNYASVSPELRVYGKSAKIAPVRFA